MFWIHQNSSKIRSEIDPTHVVTVDLLMLAGCCLEGSNILLRWVSCEFLHHFHGNLSHSHATGAIFVISVDWTIGGPSPDEPGIFRGCCEWGRWSPSYPLWQWENGDQLGDLGMLGSLFWNKPMWSCDPCGQIVGPRDFCLVFWFILDHTCGWVEIFHNIPIFLSSKSYVTIFGIH